MSEDVMNFPRDPKEFVDSYSFVDSERVYTNGAELIPVFRVHQMLEHYFDNDEGTQPSKKEEETVQERGSSKYENVLQYVAETLQDRVEDTPVDNNFILSIVAQALLLSKNTHLDTIEFELQVMRDVMSKQTQALSDITALIASTVEVMSSVYTIQKSTK